MIIKKLPSSVNEDNCWKVWSSELIEPNQDWIKVLSLHGST